jgi:hypothetical protein
MAIIDLYRLDKAGQACGLEAAFSAARCRLRDCFTA